MKKLTGAACGVLLSLFGWSAASAEDYPEMDLRLAHILPANITGSQVDQWFVDEIEKRSGGKIKVKIFWSESMGKTGELLNLLGSGAVDMIAVSAGFFPNELPLLGATNALLMQFNNGEHAARITTELASSSDDIKKELQRNNVLPLYFHSSNPYRPFCTRAIAKVEDFAGLKMRSYGEYIPVMWKELGATGVNVLTNELYESLQRGIIDCALFPNDLVRATKLGEVAKYAWSDDDHFGSIAAWGIWVNLSVWNDTWPQSVRDLFSEVAGEALVRDATMVREAGDVALQQMIETQKVQVVDFQDMDKLRAAVTNPSELWLRNMDGKGLGDAARRMIDSWRKRQAELEKGAN